MRLETTSNGPWLRIVMPVLNEGPSLTERLKALQPLRQQGAEIVVVDGGSQDESWARALPWVDLLIASQPGRAAQMNAGAAAQTSRKPQGLLFLHADTRLPPNAIALIDAALRTKGWGRFDVRFDLVNGRMRMVASLMNWRSRWTGIATGDQAIFMRSDWFEALGGFPDQALMEDVALSGRLRALGRPACLHEKVVTSARRWQTHGFWRTVLLMWRLRLAYFLGADPAQLARDYGYAAVPPPAHASIAVMAKAPVPGFSKTRLAPLLGDCLAARQQRLLLHQTLHTVSAASMDAVVLWCSPDVAHRSFRALRRCSSVQCLAQVPGDLGARMLACVQHHFSMADAPPLLLIGTDCPVLAPGHLQAAARSLSSHDVCLIPAEDGGYVLIGMRRAVAEAFEGIEWSTPAVLAQTRERLVQAGASWAELPTLWDVDEPADWQRWQALGRSRLTHTSSA